MSDVTRILSQINDGDPAAAEQLLPLVYDELRKLAAAKLAREKRARRCRPQPSYTNVSAARGRGEGSAVVLVGNASLLRSAEAFLESLPRAANRCHKRARSCRETERCGMTNLFTLTLHGN